MTPKTVAGYNSLITVRVIWLACTASMSVRAIWLACTESRSVGEIWLVCTESRYVGNIWLDDTGSRSVGNIWLDDMESRSVGVIWLDDLTCWSCRSDLIGRSDFLVLTERSDWAIQRSVFGRLRWTSCFATSDSGSRTTRKRYAKCVLFCDEFDVQTVVVRKKNKELSLLYYLLYPWWSFTIVHYAQRWSLVSDDVVYV